MKKVVQTDRAPRPIGPYSQAIQAGEFLFTSGQVGIDPRTGKLVEGGVAAQFRHVRENLKTIMAAAGCDLTKVVKTTLFLADMGDFGEVNKVYAESFVSDPPARSTFQVAGLPLGARVEMEMVALCGKG
jgi:2-iminobutanoate/2-iminopropanoate deaminase